MKTMLKIMLLLLVSVGLAACSNNAEDGQDRNNPNGLQYFPVYSNKSHKFGLMSTDGKILFKDKFDEVTSAYNNRFFASNKGERWSCYSASANPKKISGEYISVTSFAGPKKLAVVTKADHPIEVIDTLGKTVFKLDKLDGGSKVIEATGFDNNGLAVCYTSDGKTAIVDQEGKVKMYPRYGRYVTTNGLIMHSDIDSLKTKSGELFDLDGKKIIDFTDKAPSFVGIDEYFGNKTNYIEVDSIIDSQRKSVSVIDKDGNIIMEPNTRINHVNDIRNEMAIYSTKDGWGLQTTKGDNLIDPKYNALFFVSDSLLCAVNSESVNLINIKDSVINSDLVIYDKAFFANYDGKHIFVNAKDGDNTKAVCYNSDGSLNKDINKILDDNKFVIGATINDYDGFNLVFADNLSSKDIINSLQITSNSILGLNCSGTFGDLQKLMQDYSKSYMLGSGMTDNGTSIGFNFGPGPYIIRAMVMNKRHDYSSSLSPYTSLAVLISSDHKNELFNSIQKLLMPYGRVASQGKDNILIKGKGIEYYLGIQQSGEVLLIYSEK